MWYRIRDHNLLQLTAIQLIDGIAAQNAMSDNGDCVPGAMLNHNIGGFHERSTCVCHVVDDDGGLVFDVADKNHFGHLVGSGPLFVDQGEGDVKGVGYGCGPGMISTGLGGKDRRMNLLAPPASGDTMTHSRVFTFSLIHLKVLGSAYKLSTGTLKNPCI